MLTRIPAASRVITSEDPPKEMNGSGIPVTGSTPITAPTLMIVSDVIQATMASASRPPNRSGARVAARSPNQASAPSRASTATAPTSPSSSPMTEKMKSVWALGR